MSKDLHQAPFDDGTKAKLAIFQDYLRQWLPVFLAGKEIYWKTINIFDFFAGPGSDVKGIKGTPLIITEELFPYFQTIISKKLNVNLYFNEFDKNKSEELRTKLLPKDEDLRPYVINIDSLDFKQAFKKTYPTMGNKDSVNILFLDQSGIKQISEEIFIQIIDLRRTDFLFFISSSTIKRFSEQASIIQHIKLNPSDVEKTPYHQIHRLILDYYRNLIPKGKEYYLSSFSLKKNSGLYGLIFGSNNVLGIEKFLNTCWKLDPERGEANFDIDDDNIIPNQIDMFTNSVSKPKKVDLFENELKEKILNKELRTDKDIYLFSLSNGFTPVHCRALIRKFIGERLIAKCTLDLSNKICKPNARLTEIKLI